MLSYWLLLHCVKLTFNVGSRLYTSGLHKALKLARVKREILKIGGRPDEVIHVYVALMHCMHDLYMFYARA